MSICEGKALCILLASALLKGNAYRITYSTEVSITKTQHTNDTVGGAVSGTDTECTSVFLCNSNFKNYSVWLNTRSWTHIYSLKVSQVVDTLIASGNFLLVQRLTNLGTHFTKNNLLLGFLVALYLVALQEALVDGNSKIATLIYMKVANLCENISILSILLFNGLNVILKKLAVQNISSLHCKKLLKGFCGLSHTIALEGNGLQHRVFQYVVCYDNALWNLFKARIKVIEITCVINGLIVINNGLSLVNISWLGKDCCLYSLNCLFAGSINVNLYNSLSVELIELLV